MSTPSLILLGGGGHCRSVIDLIRAMDISRIHGILDQKELVGGTVSGCSILGTDDMIPELVRQGHGFVITAGQVGRSLLRQKLYEAVRMAGGQLVTITSPHAYVASDAQVGPGVTIGHGAVVNSGARVGANCIVNTGAIVEHDTVVEPHCHISTGAIVNGGCTIGPACMIGSRAVILQGVNIGADCVIGAGAVVLRDVPQGLTMVGVPADRIAP